MTTATSIQENARTLGHARLDVAKNVKTPEDWKTMWKKEQNSFPFTWGECWKSTVEYRVTDFAAEVDFFLDILGFPTNAFSADYVMFISPNKDFFFSITPTPEGKEPTPGDSFTLEFMVTNIEATETELKNRGIEFTANVAPFKEGSGLLTASFQTPNGIPVKLWSLAKPAATDKSCENYTAYQTAMTGVLLSFPEGMMSASLVLVALMALSTESFAQEMRDSDFGPGYDDFMRYPDDPAPSTLPERNHTSHAPRGLGANDLTDFSLEDLMNIRVAEENRYMPSSRYGSYYKDEYYLPHAYTPSTYNGSYGNYHSLYYNSSWTTSNYSYYGSDGR